MKHRNLASERVRIGLNQTECASSLGVSVKKLVKYENNSDTIPGEILSKAAEFFGCSTDYLLDMTDERKPTA